MMHFAKPGCWDYRAQSTSNIFKSGAAPGTTLGFMEPHLACSMGLETDQPGFESQPFYILYLPLNKLLCLSEPQFSYL